MAGKAKPVLTDLLSLLFNFDEPVYYPKKHGRIFELPDTSYFLNEFHRTEAEDIKKKASAKDLIAVKRLSNEHLYNSATRNAAFLERTAPFSIFIHSAHASAFINHLKDLHSWEDLLSAGVYWRDRLNPEMFVYCLCTVLLHRRDTSTLRIPPLVKIFPGKVICHDQLPPRAPHEITRHISPSHYLIPKNCTATQDDMEHRLSYFREDLALNEHHNHWHLVYPNSGDKKIIDKDRRGEQFYYMHHQMVARYNFERFCNGLERADPLVIEESQTAIREPYFPKLTGAVATYNYPGRPRSMILQDIKRPNDNLDITLDKMRQWAKSIEDAIQNGYVLNEKKQIIELNNDKGIDVLGNMVEASDLSPDKQVYGNLHNMGHVAISLVHDPDGSQRESFAVMGDQTIAVRDPVFFRWHTYIDQIFGRHKNKLKKYEKTDLKFDSVVIEAVDVINEEISTDPCQPDRTELTNQIQTFREWRCIEVPYKLDFAPLKRKSKFAFNQLQHEEFSYRIKVSNTGKEKVVGTCRIFMAPSELPHLEEPTFNDIINFWIEMDKFSVELEPGSNCIMRRSVDSSVTIPFDQTFGEGTTLDTIDAKYCGCGWPHNLLVPKGTSEGYQAILFVMISNDQLKNEPVDEMKARNDRGEERSQKEEAKCKEASSYCGLMGKKYPDTRAMGFPFDRTTKFNDVSEFKSSNMIFQEIIIKFDGSREPFNF